MMYLLCIMTLTFQLKIDNERYAQLSKFPLSNGEILPTLEDFLREGLVDNHTTKLILEIKVI